MTRLRRLNPRGVKALRQFLQKIREGEEFQANPAILHVDEYSERVTPSIEIEALQFPRRFDAARYLVETLRPIDSPALPMDAGLWSWLALFYFEQLAPRREDGTRRPREDYHYIPEEGHGWSTDRHLLAGPYRLYREHGEHARLMLHLPLHQHGAFIYDLGFRREMISNRGLVEAIDLLYWDHAKGRPKRAATTTTRGGTLRRLIAVIQQLELNFDLLGMTAREILELLPAEFDAWKPAPLLR